MKAVRDRQSCEKHVWGPEDRATKLELQVCGCAMVGKAGKAHGT